MRSEILTLLGMALLAKPPKVSKQEAQYLRPSANWLSRDPAEAREWLRCVSKGVAGLGSRKRCRRLNSANFVHWV